MANKHRTVPFLSLRLFSGETELGRISFRKPQEPEHKCFICGDPADLQLEDGQWECDNCSDIAADFSMEQERENNN